MNVLFLPLNKKETTFGVLIAVLYLAVGILLESTLPAERYWVQCVFALLFCGAVILCALRFWKESFRCIPLSGWQLVWKPLLAVVACKVICVVCNDIALFFELPYFVMTDWGPILWDVRSVLMNLAADHCFLPVAAAVILFMPVAEEFIFRGVILGTIYPKHSVIAVIVSVLLFTLFHTVPYIGRMDDLVYMAVYSVQFIPMGLFLAWLYISTDSIFAPVLMHLIWGAMLIF